MSLIIINTNISIQFFYLFHSFLLSCILLILNKSKYSITKSVLHYTNEEIFLLPFSIHFSPLVAILDPFVLSVPVAVSMYQKAID